MEQKKTVYISSTGEIKKKKSLGDYFSLTSIHNFFIQLFNIIIMFFKSLFSPSYASDLEYSSSYNNGNGGGGGGGAPPRRFNQGSTRCTVSG